MDPLLLTAGLTRVAFWLVACALAWRDRRAVPSAGFGLTAGWAAVFALSNSGGALPHWLFALSAFAATPTSALVVAAYYLRTPPGGPRATRWRL